MSQYSLSSQYYETLKQLQKNIEAFDNMPLEEARKNQKNFISTISDNCIANEVKVDKKYVIKSKEYLVDKLKIYEDVINEKWQDLDNNGLYQFPAQLCDTLAAYLYLTNPGTEAGFELFNPKQIIFSGSSAGGGLAVAIALFQDLFYGYLYQYSNYLQSSMLSCWDPEIDKTGYLLAALSILRFKSLASEFHKWAKLLEEKIKQKKPKVSLMFAESLGNLLSILCQVGSGEKFLDSSILFSFRASDPNKFQVSKYATMNFVNSQFKKPTEVILEVYDKLFYCFQQNHTLNEYILDDANIKSLQGIHKTVTAIAISPNLKLENWIKNI
ncbi:44239_t:CDS:2 [Gigaspora margarita]|uniref:44239_t:CDS:1 n=1 Tax=Gigaspora margarita TaxID=4874 RepID=A0ABN7UQ90_GIGMA|nr:44239_t:CDS:2 [Gigaspora margarita]